MSRRNTALALTLFSVALGALNQFLFKPFWGQAFPFLAWYANDVIAGFFLPAFTQFLLARGHFPPLSLSATLLLVPGAGTVWELLPQLWSSSAVADPWDMAAYLAGGALFHLLFRFFTSKDKA